MAIVLELATESRGRRGADFQRMGDPKQLRLLDFALLERDDVEVVRLDADHPDPAVD